MEMQIPQREGAILGDSPGHSKALVICAAAVATVLLRLLCCKKDYSIACNVMQQNGLFSMPGKHE